MKIYLCKSKKQNGKPCTANALVGSKYCGHHDPEVVARRSASIESGLQARETLLRTGGELPEKVKRRGTLNEECGVFKRNGVLCTANVLVGSEYCGHHDPEVIARRSASFESNIQAKEARSLLLSQIENKERELVALVKQNQEERASLLALYFKQAEGVKAFSHACNEVSHILGEERRVNSLICKCGGRVDCPWDTC
jgi:hypothetical protein